LGLLRTTAHLGGERREQALTRWRAGAHDCRINYFQQYRAVPNLLIDTLLRSTSRPIKTARQCGLIDRFDIRRGGKCAGIETAAIKTG
jgi:hypothetical protein